MGQDERLSPFYFAKPADAIVPDGGTVPYLPLTKDIPRGRVGRRSRAADATFRSLKASDRIYGYAVGIDLTRRTCRSPRAISSGWEIGKGSTIPLLGAPAGSSRLVIRTKGKITLT